tara:strand:- start:147 stop:434 length:288 start_codon:yes stop_codon:yes gene_type:complete
LNNYKIKLKNDSQISIELNNNLFDIVKKEWGYYLSPSFQNRLKKNSIITFAIINKKNYELHFINKNKRKSFIKYLNERKLKFKDLSNSLHFKNYF